MDLWSVDAVECWPWDIIPCHYFQGHAIQVSHRAAPLPARGKRVTGGREFRQRKQAGLDGTCIFLSLGTWVCESPDVSVHTAQRHPLNSTLTASKSVANTADKGGNRTGLVHGDSVCKEADDSSATRR